MNLFNNVDFKFYIEDMKPIKFFSYPSSVRKPIFTINRSVKNLGHFYEVQRSLVDKFKTAGVKSSIDNKTVFGVEYHDTLLYIGFYDGEITIGLEI